MASASGLLSEQHFLCSICMDALTDPVTIPCGHNYCKACITRYWDSSDVCNCPLCAKIFDKRPDVYVNTLVSQMVQQFRSNKLKEEYEAKTDAGVQQMIQERQLKIQEVGHSVELSRKDADEVMAVNVQVFKALYCFIAMKKLCDAEVRRIQQYAVDVTLDPDTAHCDLIMSEDGKQVSDGNIRKNRPDNTKRFSSYVNVLGKQNFSSGRFYYEVQVTGKTEWTLGVARESINRKGVSPLCPTNGYWTIALRNGYEYMAAADLPVLLHIREKLQKVGVFVDYEEGLVSFSDVENKGHLYSYTGCTFTEKLYPLFSPGVGLHFTNFAPLIISPVNMDAGLGEDGGNVSPPSSKRIRTSPLQ